MTLPLITLLTFLPIPLAQAQTSHSLSSGKNSNNQPSSEIQFTPPALPSRGRPVGRRRGGASRGSCNLAAGQPALTALIPTSPENNTPLSNQTTVQTTEQSNDSAVETVFSLTAQPYPSFWFFLPYLPNETPLEFVLQDENNNTLYQQTLSATSNESGIIQVTLPTTAPALEENVPYHWFFIASCDDTNPAFVEGWTTRVSLENTLPLELNTATSKEQLREQAALYAQNSLWQETLTLIGTSHRNNPEDPVFLNDWQSLLESAGLSELVIQPLIDCCEAP